MVDIPQNLDAGYFLWKFIEWLPAPVFSVQFANGKALKFYM